MKNTLTKLTCLSLLFICSHSVFAQTVWDTLPWKSYADYRLQPLNKTYVTTGILYDRVFPIAHMDEHTGLSSTEDTTSSDHFKQGYYEMYNSIYNTAGISTPDDVENILDTFSIYNGHPIGVLYYKFNSLDTNALATHLVDTLANGQFTDVANRLRSPYFNNTAFLASPLIAEDEVFQKGTHTFYIDSRFFLQNASAHVTQIRIDFGDGQGQWVVNNPYDNLSAPVGINSPTSIGSFITKVIGGSLSGRIFIVIVDALGYGIEYSNPFHISVPGGKSEDDYPALTTCKGLQKWVITAPQARLDPINTIYGNPQLSYTRKVKDPNGNGNKKITIPVKDTAYFYFAGTGSSCTQSVLHKPIVFIDGIDPTNTRGVKTIYEEYINKQVTRNSQQVKFGDYMLSQLYDFVILDYKHGNDLMERNAMTLVSLLEQLYQTYGSTFQQDITIIGPSMGSEVAQYALAYMEHNNIPTHVKTYISFDGPQQGANVPIGLQNMVEYISKRGLLFKIKATKSLIRNGLYNGLAARQLIAHHTSANALFPTPDALRTKFLNNLQAVGTYPALCRKVAIIDGVSNGILNPAHTTNNESLMHIINKRKGWKSVWGLCNANICKNVDWEVKGAPSFGTAKVMDMWTLNPIINLIFWVPPFETTKSASAAWANSSQENAPGATFAPIFGAPGAVDESKISFLTKEFFYLLTGSKRTTFTQNLNNFTFIPSYSAGDLRFPTMIDNSGKNLYLNWANTYLCGHTPFDFVYAPTDANHQHVAVTQQISEWFESEVRCNRADLPVIFNPVINGLPYLCNTTQPYSVNFCQTGNHSITWATSNPSVATISGSGDQISVTSHSNGTANITATISYPCSYSISTPIVLTKQITVGVSTPSIVILGIAPYPNTQMDVQVNTNEYGPYKWYVDNVLVQTTYQTQTTINGGGCGSHVLKVEVSNSCSTASATTNYTRSCSMFTISPNPATDNVSVDVVQPTNVASVNTKKVMIYQIKITDQVGNVKKQYKYSGVSNTVISLQGLIDGMYTIQAFDGTKWSSMKVVKQ